MEEFRDYLTLLWKYRKSSWLDRVLVNAIDNELARVEWTLIYGGKYSGLCEHSPRWAELTRLSGV
jgi:hypothetical protein